jgi:hypothetical protein
MSDAYKVSRNGIRSVISRIRYWELKGDVRSNFGIHKDGITERLLNRYDFPCRMMSCIRRLLKRTKSSEMKEMTGFRMLLWIKSNSLYPLSFLLKLNIVICYWNKWASIMKSAEWFCIGLRNSLAVVSNITLNFSRDLKWTLWNARVRIIHVGAPVRMTQIISLLYQNWNQSRSDRLIETRWIAST